MQITEKEIETIQPTNILPQTSFWGRIKETQGFSPNGFELKIPKELLNPTNKENQSVQEDLLVFLKDIGPSHCFAYVPYGPKLEPYFENQGVFLEELSEVLRGYLPHNCVFIRYDLAWQNQWAEEDEYYDNSDNWMGPPESSVQEFRVNYKTAEWNLRKSPVDILPKNTFFLDLSLGEDELLYNMRYNTRYNIKRSKKQGLSVKEYGVGYINDWYELYRETTLRHNMPLQNKAYFESVLKHQDDVNNGVQVKMLMADDGHKFLASMFLVLSNKRGTYLYGASSTDQKNKMASYALQWEAIKTAKKHGCKEYDMFGSAPNLNRKHPLHGVHIYKKGFGGNLFHRMGCWDYPYLQKEYEMIKMQEMYN